ncbi:SIMPL domain-containing protein [Solimicrobium silvestre]|uniref:Periplasmic/secreted protein n=1 Tax=Solimicrobium silvestre TaxID=2099400 RepID=A0A2S9GVF5_9BURK|nr:SIMPL domain-containing protein [Solimicrobium silvestre]PRC91707.1 hypothetical protein S2091_3645 [Solimicrobium silvestre]
MKKLFITATVVLCYLFSTQVFAQQTKGSLIVVSGTGEVKAENDQANATFFIEEQDKDKAAAAGRVNKKMKDGTEILKKADPEAKLATRGYYTYPVYSDTLSSAKTRTITGWRVGQYLELTTKNIQQLPATVAAAQQTLALNGLSFGLSDATMQRLDAARLEAAYKNMQERVQAIAKAMGRDAASAVIETLDFDGTASHPEPRMFAAAAPMMARSNSVPETNFEAGESTLTAKVVAKIKFN